LLGLAWYLVIFEMVREYRVEQDKTTSPSYLRIKVGDAPCWMHVVDDTVYQVIERGRIGNATVRNLSASIPDPLARRALSQWARENVRSMARRGGRAEEYVFSLLHRAAIAQHFDKDDPLDDAVLRKVLKNLGMDDFLDLPTGEFLIETGEADLRMNRSVWLDGEYAKKSCVAVFSKLIDYRFKENNCQYGSQCDIPREVRHLASETL
jgi:hypothetical protein